MLNIDKIQQQIDEDQNANRILARRFLDRATAYLLTKSDPIYIQQIFNELNIDNFEPRDENFKDFTTKIRREPIDLTSLIEGFKIGILNNVLLCELLAFIEKEELVSDVELEQSANQLQIGLNFLCLFEAFSVTMSNSPTLTEDIYSFLVNQRNVSYPGNPINNLLFGFRWDRATIFKNLKAISLEPGIIAGAFVRSLEGNLNDNVEEKAKKFIEKHGLMLWNARIQPYSLGEVRDVSVKNVSINILEVIWEDIFRDNRNPNTCAGAVLIAMLEYLRPHNNTTIKDLILREGGSLINDNQYDLLPDLTVNSQNKVVSEFQLSKEWVDLYSSWNLRFLTQLFDGKYLPLKLLTPSILNAIPNEYMESRVFVLFLIGNFFHKNEVHIFDDTETKIENLEKIFSKWSEINDAYANELLQKCCPKLGKTSEDILNDIFGNTENWNFTKHLINFARNFDNFRILPELESLDEQSQLNEENDIVSCNIL